VLFANALNHVGVQVQAEVIRDDNGPIAQQLHLPVYCWSPDSSPPKAVIFAIHGATLHGRVFDSLAKHLASEGYLFYAIDLRGFGSWRTDATKYGGDSQIHYTQSMHDLVEVLTKLHRDYPSLKTYCLGESLGANLALWLGAYHADIIDGIIISSPCVKAELHPSARMAIDFAKGFIDPYEGRSMTPYIKPYISEDKRVTRTYLADPLITKKLSPADLIKSIKTNENTLKDIKNIPSYMPILVLAGGKDKIYDAKALPGMVSQMGSKRSTIDVEKTKGHLLLETDYLDSEILAQIDKWLAENTSEKTQTSQTTVKDQQINALN
jgi:alpha-beta hydrolase superfamily lysophospholipase